MAVRRDAQNEPEGFFSGGGWFGEQKLQRFKCFMLRLSILKRYEGLRIGIASQAALKYEGARLELERVRESTVVRLVLPFRRELKLSLGELAVLLNSWHERLLGEAGVDSRYKVSWSNAGHLLHSLLKPGRSEGMEVASFFLKVQQRAICVSVVRRLKRTRPFPEPSAASLSLDSRLHCCCQHIGSELLSKGAYLEATP